MVRCRSRSLPRRFKRKILGLKMNRIIQLDIAKAICIILVVIGHYIPSNSPSWYIIIHDIIYTFHMPLFMFASGYIYIATKKEISYTTFIKKKLKRLMIPYFSTSIIIITIKLLTQKSMNVENPVTIFSYVKMFYMPEAGYFLWFIWSLWWMFIIIPLIKTPKMHSAFFLLCLIITFIPFTLPNEFCFEQCKKMFVFFMFGILSFENKYLKRLISEFKPTQTIIISLLFFIAEIIFFTSPHYIVSRIISFLLPYIGILFVIEISKIISQYCITSKDNFLMIISASSYIIYLFHTTFEGFAKAIFEKILSANANTQYFVLEAIIIITMGITLPIVFHKYILKRWRFSKFLFGLNN